MNKKRNSRLVSTVLGTLAVLLIQQLTMPYFKMGIFHLLSHRTDPLPVAALGSILDFLVPLLVVGLMFTWYLHRNQVTLRKGKKGWVKLNGYRVKLLLDDVKVVMGATSYPWIEATLVISTFKDGPLDEFHGKFRPNQAGEYRIYPIEASNRKCCDWNHLLTARWRKGNKIRFELAQA